MTDYAWTCPACGQANDAGSTACAACECPAAFSARDVEDHRRRFLAGGGTVQPGAATTPDAKDYAVFRALFAAPLLALGWWPFGRDGTENASRDDER